MQQQWRDTASCCRARQGETGESERLDERVKASATRRSRENVKPRRRNCSKGVKGRGVWQRETAARSAWKKWQRLGGRVRAVGGHSRRRRAQKESLLRVAGRRSRGRVRRCRRLYEARSTAKCTALVFDVLGRCICPQRRVPGTGRARQRRTRKSALRSVQTAETESAGAYWSWPRERSRSLGHNTTFTVFDPMSVAHHMAIKNRAALQTSQRRHPSPRAATHASPAMA
jgi:hypothetical protein